MRAAILALLSEQPMHGYQMIQELSRRSGGAWTPSPGSIYPTLQMLEDEGLVASSQSDDGKRMFELTDTGRAEYSKSGSGQGHRPWEQSGHGRSSMPVDLVAAIRDTALALVYAATTGTDEQRAEVISLLGDLREKLGAIAPGSPAPGGPSGFFGMGSRPFGQGGRPGPSWASGVPGWLFGGAPGGPFGPGGIWGSKAQGPTAGSSWPGSAGDDDLDAEGADPDDEVADGDFDAGDLNV